MICHVPSEGENIDPHEELSQTCHFHIAWASFALVGWFGDRQKFIQSRHGDKNQVGSSYGSTGNKEKIPPTLGVMHVVPCQGGSDQRGHKASGLMFKYPVNVDEKSDIFLEKFLTKSISCFSNV